MGENTVIKETKNQVDGLYRNIAAVVLFLCCTAIAWGSSEIISLGKENIEIKGRITTLETLQNKDRDESARQFTEFEKKLDKMETQVNKKLEAIEGKLDRLINKQP